MNFKALQDAVLSLWVLPASGLPAASVYFGTQEEASPAPGPCIAIALGDYLKRGFDGLTSVYDGTKPNGQEIQRTASGHREVSVNLAAFSPNAVELDTPTARAILAQVHAALSLPSVRMNLINAGIGIISEGEIRWLPQIQKAGWEGRAVLETRLRVVETASEALGYIATVNVNGTVKQANDESSPATFVVTINAP